MLKIEHVSFSYENHEVLHGINLHVKRGETIGILGQSGVGKTTLFQLITGLMELQTGEISLDGSSDVKGSISYMLQNDMLYKHYTVLENIILPRIIAKDSKEKAKELALELLEEFGLAKWANYYPHALSGGMRQRIAFLRTAAFKRDWLLLDEAFSALDAFTRRQLHKWFLETKERLGWSTLLITHDVDEALILCDRVYVISGTPGTISHELKTDFQLSNSQEIIYEEAFLQAKKELLSVIEAKEAKL